MGAKYRLEGTYKVTAKGDATPIREEFATRREAQLRKDDLELVDVLGLSSLKIVEVQS